MCIQVMILETYTQVERIEITYIALAFQKIWAELKYDVC